MRSWEKFLKINKGSLVNIRRIIELERGSKMKTTAFYNLILKVTSLFPYSVCYKQVTRSSLHSRGEDYTQA